MTDIVLQAKGLTKAYRQGDTELVILQDLALEVRAGERVAIIGRSGSGKSTLLHILAGLDQADKGEILVGDMNMHTADSNRRAEIRRLRMGFVYQLHHLLGEFTALENVAMPLRLLGHDAQSANEQAQALLNEVGLADRVSHYPAALSGGERQRVAVARSLAGQPAIVLADEPTGNLDAHNADQVMALIARLGAEHNTAFLVVTHDNAMLDQFDRVLRLIDGRLSAH